MIDLRSDTLTQPTPAMRQAMASADVGDDVLDSDPTVNRLERFTAELLGKESALFMPTGTMSNQVGVRVHCNRGSEFICEADAHIYYYEQGAFAQLSGLVARTVAGDQGVLKSSQLRGSLRPDDIHAVRTRLVCLENTHNRWGGMVTPQADIVDVCRWAHDEGLVTHLDGARLWNAAVTTGIAIDELVAPFDSISVCFSKGLGAPVGSALVGTADFIHEAKRARKLFGGAMRQAGIIAAGALHALHHHRERLVEDHQHAKLLADAACQSKFVTLRANRVDTNLVVLDIDQAWGTAAEFQQQLRLHDVDCFAIGPQAIRLVTHMDVTAEQIHQASGVLDRVGSNSATSVTA